ncbi:tRNA dihydrouridine synthase [Desulforhopalus singaporensis]|uniref:tRNA-dihydrouridine synthase n=1 Tax=Desulforhopalus singaporensis TaxID=91360 RepID=A0A1H0PVU7_9BACT|nr:tRNA-dihydrouridine synthase family protein [Desulforhopalus singaporensis]SDP08920.1 putative TIM-barrel protein, nifR3 family [Desulforhopalus singaporensis]
MADSKNIATVKVRTLSVWPPVALAPMVGLTHSALRSTIQAIGGVGLFYTEMLAAKRLPSDNPRCSPPLIRAENERPLVYQLVGADLRYIKPAIDKILTLEPQGIDFNLGCPAPMQKKQGAGSSLVDSPAEMRAILEEIRKATELPLSVKIRLGHSEDGLKLAEFCKILEGEGVDLITVHARLIGEKFCRVPRWHLVRHAKKAVRIPVFANGGIFTVEDAKNCLEQSRADGIMIGRGGVTNPWLCADIARELFGFYTNSGISSKAEMYERFITLLEQRFPKERRLGRLKKFTSYFCQSFYFGHHFGTTVQGCSSVEEVRHKAAEFFATVDLDQLS